MSARNREEREPAREEDREAREPRPGQEERIALLRSTWVLNPGIPHFVDFPPPGQR